jgi:hypothetical protein
MNLEEDLEAIFKEDVGNRNYIIKNLEKRLHRKEEFRDNKSLDELKDEEVILKTILILIE